MNEIKEKQESRAAIRFKLFWKIQWECIKASLISLVLYFSVGMLMLATNLIKIPILQVIVGIVCIAYVGVINAYLSFRTGKQHYERLEQGKIYRENVLFGMEIPKEHCEEKEYRWWKGFVSGFYIGLPVLFFGALIAITNSEVLELIATYTVGWAMELTVWLTSTFTVLPQTGVSWLLSYVMVLVPFVISGVFYILGARKQKRLMVERRERADQVMEMQKKSRKK